MSRIPRLLPLVAAAVLLPAAAASAIPFSGTTSDGNPITFDADGQTVTNVNTSYPIYCTSKAGTELFQPTGSLIANGAETKVSELQRSVLLDRDVTQNIAFTATIDGTQASGKIDVNFATVDYDLLSNTMKTTVCSGETSFTASAPQVGQPQQDQPVAQQQEPKKKPKKKAKKKRGKHAKGHHAGGRV